MTLTDRQSRLYERVYPALGQWAEYRQHSPAVARLGYPSSTILGRLARQFEAALISGQGLRLDDAPEDVHTVQRFLDEVASSGEREAVERKWSAGFPSDARCARKLGYANRQSYQRVLHRAYDRLDGYLHAAHRERYAREDARVRP